MYTGHYNKAKPSVFCEAYSLFRILITKNFSAGTAVYTSIVCGYFIHGSGIVKGRIWNNTLIIYGMRVY